MILIEPLEGHISPKSYDATLLCPTCITAHLSTLKLICQSAAHSCRLSKSLCSAATSSKLATCLQSFVSSANFANLEIILLSKSLIYTKNKTGPNTEPCGTPLVTSRQCESC